MGDVRRRRRLIRIAAAYAERPRGTVTEVLARADEREGAYRFVENARVDFRSIGAASHVATARRCASASDVVVAVDQTSLSVTDRVGKSGFGATAGEPTGRGLQVMTALAIGDEATEGILAQQWWSREEKAPHHRVDTRPPKERESDLWRRTLVQAQESLMHAAPDTRAWYQLDRGADSAAVLELAVDSDLHITVRSAYNRTLAAGSYLHTWMRNRRPVGHYSLDISKTHKRRRARTAVMALRASRVNLRLNTNKGHPRRRIQVWCVHAREQRAPQGEHRLEWFLITTKPVETPEDALRVVQNYNTRWRVEEFHRAWKSGVCNVENSQLRSADAFKRWATIAAAVAARAERLKTHSRVDPDQPAIAELSRDEIDAAILLSKRASLSPGDELTLGQAVRLIADLGGYTGKSSGGPPGTRVIQRGLEQVLTVAGVLETLRRSD